MLRVPLLWAESKAIDVKGVAVRRGRAGGGAAAGELRFMLPEGSSQVPGILNILVSMGVAVDGMTVESPNLESVFLAFTGKALRDHESSGGAA